MDKSATIHLPTLSELIAKGEGLNQGLWSALEEHAKHPDALTTKKIALAHSDMISAAERLASNMSPMDKLKAVKDLLPSVQITSIEKLQEFVQRQLVDLNQLAHDKRLKLGVPPGAPIVQHTVQYNSPAATAAAIAAEEKKAAKAARKGMGEFAGSIGTKIYKTHERLMPKTIPARMAFGAAEFFLGQTLMQIGSDRLTLAMNGTKQKQVQQVGPDGTTSIAFVPEKLPSLERLTDAVIAGVTLPVGVLGIGFGAKNFFMPHLK